MTGDAVGSATALVRERFPAASVAVLGGSVDRGTATRTSDLDIVVLFDGPPGPHRETVRHDGWPVELFVHTRESLTEWFAKDRARRRNTLADMCAYGVVLVDRGSAEAVRREAREADQAGPEPATPEELALARYALTDALDDLVGAEDPGERSVIAAQVLVEAAELALLSQRRWSGSGKWLLRRLREMDSSLAERLVEAHRRAVAEGEPDDLVAASEAVLDAVGGRLTEGFRLGG